MSDLRIHPRERIVRKAEAELTAALTEIGKNLTEGEYLRVVTEVLSRCWTITVKHMIRSERHPSDPDMPGGLAQ